MSDESITIDELTQACGVAYRTAKRRLRAAGVQPCYQDKRGMRYPRAEAFAAIEAGEESELAGGQISARERLDLARARREELELAHLAKRVMYVDEAVRVWESMIVAARSQMLAIPAMADTPADFRPVLDRRIRDALHRLSEWEPPEPDEVSGNEPMQTSALRRIE